MQLSVCSVLQNIFSEKMRKPSTETPLTGYFVVKLQAVEPNILLIKYSIQGVSTGT